MFSNGGFDDQKKNQNTKNKSFALSSLDYGCDLFSSVPSPFDNG